MPATAAILNQDGTVNGPSNPTHIGDTVAMFVSGVGQTNPAGVDGEIPQAAGGTPLLPITVQLNFHSMPYADVTYAGNAPGLVSGAVQVNFQHTTNRICGRGRRIQVPVVLDVGGTSAEWRPLGPVVWIRAMHGLAESCRPLKFLYSTAEILTRKP